ncbi:MAG TPA: hypothetical protein V6C71_10715 [Coleofasciculaceae cyanobacterium]|jgi:hypothetical protein
MKRKSLFAVTAILATLMPATIALAGLNRNSPAILTKLINRTASKQLGAGYTSPKTPVIAEAEPGGVFSRNFNLSPGKNYGFIAVCEQRECFDVDLVVYDNKGKQMIADQSDSPEAVVKFKPTKKAAYTVEVEMYECDDPRACALAIGAYRK